MLPQGAERGVGGNPIKNVLRRLRPRKKIKKNIIGDLKVTWHLSTLISMNDLAEVLSHQGKYKEAEEMH
jgi:hypothetical protein